MPYLTRTVILLAFLWMASLPVVGRADEEIEVKSQISYRPDAPECRLDLYLPKDTRKPYSMLIWVHGGGLTGGDKAEPPSAAVSRLLAMKGIGVASVNYRLSPKVRFPVYIEDVAAAVAWVDAHAAEWGGHSGRVYLSGHSAGAYLVAMLTMNPKYLDAAGFDRRHLAGVIPISGQVATHFTVRKERGLDINAITSDEAAPLYFVRQNIPDMLLLLGDRDWPARLEENAYFAACLKAAGATNVTLRVISDRDHGTIFGKLPEPNDPTGKLLWQFIAERESRSLQGAHSSQ